MPEMPEVETIRRSLEKKLQGRQILKCDVLLPRQVKWPDANGFAARTTGRRIERLERRGKYLLFLLDNGNEMIIHLRMTGRLLYQANGLVQDAYARILFQLDHGAMLVYADTRTLGAVYALHAGERWRIRGLVEMGPEPLTADFTQDYLAAVLTGRKTAIKSFLLDQRKIGGLGNIYADEALFAAGIHPQRMAGSLNAVEIRRLFTGIQQVIAAGIADGGTTFRDYIDGNGKKGHHQEHLRVYHQEGTACSVCGTRIEKITVGGRGTHFCPHCQLLAGSATC